MKTLVGNQNSIKARMYTSAFVLFFISAAILFQIRFDLIQAKQFDLYAPLHRYVMPAEIVQHFTFGFNAILADYYWLTAVQDFNKWDRKDTYFPEYFRIISTLDPKFEYPYIFATLVIPNRTNKESLAWLSEISEMGMWALPENWEIPYYTGVQYHVVGKMPDRAADYLKIASEIENSPEYVDTAYGIYLMRDSTEYQKSRALFTAIYESSTNEETRRIAKERIFLLDFIETSEQAVLRYKEKYGMYPKSIEELANSGLLTLSPDIAKKIPVSIDQSTGKILIK